MIVLKNLQDNQIIEFANESSIGIFFRNWHRMNQNEIQEYLECKAFNNKKNQLINVRINYLKNTDWYISREIDEPNSYPEVVKDKRILARQEINNIENCNSLLELEQYSIDFN